MLFFLISKTVREVLNKIEETQTKNHEGYVRYAKSIRPHIEERRLRQTPLSDVSLSMVDLIYRIGLTFDTLLKNAGMTLFKYPILHTSLVFCLILTQNECCLMHLMSIFSFEHTMS